MDLRFAKSGREFCDGKSQDNARRSFTGMNEVDGGRRCLERWVNAGFMVFRDDNGSVPMVEASGNDFSLAGMKGNPNSGAPFMTVSLFP